MSYRYWKHCERQSARLLGGKRNTEKGIQAHDVIDHPWLSIEVKSRASIPAWLIEGMAQAVEGAGDKLPVVVIWYKGKPPLIQMRLKDFIDWFGDGGDENHNPRED